MDSFTEHSSESWFERIGGSFKGILVGIILLIISAPLLWWNEGRTVDRQRALEEGAGAVISVPSDTINPQNEGKLIHTTGPARGLALAQDPIFGVSAQALQVRRTVEMFQWKQEKRTKSKDNLAGGKSKKTTYTYKQVWEDTLIKSDRFEYREGHRNPIEMPYKAARFAALDAKLGAFTLSADQIDEMGHYEPLPLTGKRFDQLNRPYHVVGDTLYLGLDPNAPMIGDVRVRFEVIPYGPASIVAKQLGQGFTGYYTQNESEILLVTWGTKDAQAMFKQAEQENRVIAWLLRFLGALLMFIGFKLISGPLDVIADIIPFVGGLVELGTTLLSFLLAISLSLLIIAVAWIFYRPLLGGGIFLVGAAAFVVPAMLRGKGR